MSPSASGAQRDAGRMAAAPSGAAARIAAVDGYADLPVRQWSMTSPHASTTYMASATLDVGQMALDNH